MPHPGVGWEENLVMVPARLIYQGLSISLTIVLEIIRLLQAKPLLKKVVLHRKLPRFKG